MRSGLGRLSAIIAVLLALAGCGSDGASESGATGTLRIYTTVTEDTVDAVVEGFEAANPGAAVEVFRAPTGEVAARIAAEVREGGLQADVLWMTDPLSIEQYARDGLLRRWTPANIDVVRDEYRTDAAFGTRVLNMVIVAGTNVDPVPADWDDLAAVDGGVVIPDPAFAGSAYGALAYFALAPDYGMDFYSELAAAGGVQVQTPGDVVTGVAEGTYGAGMTLDRTARDAVDDGSPLTMVWPESGAISIYSPIAVVDATQSGLAERFVEYVLGEEAQRSVAGTGWEPIRSDVGWPDTGTHATVDWEGAFTRQDELLEQYHTAFGG